jgi:hypothetical protein
LGRGGRGGFLSVHESRTVVCGDLDIQEIFDPQVQQIGDRYFVHNVTIFEL